MNKLSNYRIWNAWKGCFPVSEACENCFISTKNMFNDVFYPLDLSNYKAGTIITMCISSDFFIPEADKYRSIVWNRMKEYPHLLFKIITKRVERISECLPEDWNDGYDNVILCATVETQARANERLSVFEKIPAKHRWIACTPLLEKLDITQFLASGMFEMVEVLGERTYKNEARPVKHAWVLNLKQQCIYYNVRMALLGVGSNYQLDDGTVLSDRCRCYESQVARLVNVDHYIPITFNLGKHVVTF